MEIARLHSPACPILNDARVKCLRNFSQMERYSDRYLYYFNSPELSDVTMKIGTEIFYGHRVVLGAQVPFFRAMFSPNFSEHRKTEIDLHLLNRSAFYEVLQFIYSDNILLTKNNVAYVLDCACFLQMPNLQLMCESFLWMQSLTVESAVSVFLIAKKYDLMHIAKYAKNFILANLNAVIETTEQDFVSMDLSKLKFLLASEERVDPRCVLRAILVWIFASYEREIIYETEEIIVDDPDRSIYMRNLIFEFLSLNYQKIREESRVDFESYDETFATLSRYLPPSPENDIFHIRAPARITKTFLYTIKLVQSRMQHVMYQFVKSSNNVWRFTGKKICLENRSEHARRECYQIAVYKRNLYYIRNDFQPLRTNAVPTILRKLVRVNDNYEWEPVPMPACLAITSINFANINISDADLSVHIGCSRRFFFLRDSENDCGVNFHATYDENSQNWELTELMPCVWQHILFKVARNCYLAAKSSDNEKVVEKIPLSGAQKNIDIEHHGIQWFCYLKNIIYVITWDMVLYAYDMLANQWILYTLLPRVENPNNKGILHECYTDDDSIYVTIKYRKMFYPLIYDPRSGVWTQQPSHPYNDVWARCAVVSEHDFFEHDNA